MRAKHLWWWMEDSRETDLPCVTYWQKLGGMVQTSFRDGYLMEEET